MMVGKGIKAGTYQREAAKVGRKNVIAKDSTGGRRLCQRSDGGVTVSASVFPSQGWRGACPCRRKICVSGCKTPV